MRTLLIRNTNKQVFPFIKETDRLKRIDFKWDPHENLDRTIHQFIEGIGDEYVNILIPFSVSFRLSDFSGLKMAMHFRTTLGLNQCANLFIYGPFTQDEYRRTEYYPLLETKGVQLLDMHQEIFEGVDQEFPSQLLNEADLAEQLGSFQLRVPTDLGDKHSIANLWGVLRLASDFGVHINELHSIRNDVRLNTIYFKWLKSKYEYLESPKTKVERLKAKKLKILLIDDDSESGWAELWKAILKGCQLDQAHKLNDTQSKLKEKWDLILLDIRLNEADRGIHLPQEFSSHRILIDHIRSGFHGVNFSTPVMVTTGSTRVWNVQHFLQQGADDYYIKEHPDLISEEHSFQNTKRLKESLQSLLELGDQRRVICQLCNEVINSLDEGIESENIQTRIEHKLLIGYGLLFKRESAFERNNLMQDLGTHAFIQFFSILEELCKDWLDLASLKLKGNKVYGEWKWKNEAIVQGGPHEMKEKTRRLSSQVNSIFNDYLEKADTVMQDSFDKLRKRRNKLSLTHGSFHSILHEDVTDAYTAQEPVKNAIETLELIKYLIKVPKKTKP